jgi:hypothetical protein
MLDMLDGSKIARSKSWKLTINAQCPIGRTNRWIAQKHAQEAGAPGGGESLMKLACKAPREKGYPETAGLLSTIAHSAQRIALDSTIPKHVVTLVSTRSEYNGREKRDELPIMD